MSTDHNSARIFAKLEFQNPFRSVKDRVAIAMIDELFKKDPNFSKPILEYTGGNLGLALASICAEIDLPLKLVVSHISPALKELQSKGFCEIVLTNPELGFWNVMQTAEKIANENPNYEFLYQHKNEANLKVHENQTGPEIIQQLKKKNISACDAWVASIGTGGSLIGVYNHLSLFNPNLKLIAVSPKELPYGSLNPPNGLPKFAGSGGLGCGRKQSFVESLESKISAHYTFNLQETIEAGIHFYKSTGIQIGTSAAARLRRIKRKKAFPATGWFGLGSSCSDVIPANNSYVALL